MPMSVAGVEAEVGGHASSSLGKHPAEAEKAQPQFGLVEGNCLGAVSNSPRSFLSTWQSQLASLAATVEPDAERPIDIESTSLTSPNSAVPGISIARKMTSKLAPITQCLTAAKTTRPLAAAKLTTGSLQPAIVSGRPITNRAFKNSTAEHTSNSSPIRQVASSRSIKPDSNNQIQRQATNHLANLASSQPAPIAAPVPNLPQDIHEKVSSYVSTTLHSEVLPIARDPDHQSELHPFAAGHESTSSLKGTNGAAKDEVSQTNTTPTQSGEFSSIASTPETHISPTRSNALHSALATASPHSLPLVASAAAGLSPSSQAPPPSETNLKPVNE